MRHHAEGLRRLIKDDALVEQLAEDFRKASLSSADMAMLHYARKLTLTPPAIRETDLQKLRDEGFSDSAILDINQVAAYYAFVNRLADGLGVQLEDFWEKKGQ